jgi:hypothetical protein
VDSEFLYATLISKNLVPFGVRRYHLVALPVRIGMAGRVAELPGQRPVERFIPMSIAEMRDSIQYAASADGWFAPRKSYGLPIASR